MTETSPALQRFVSEDGKTINLPVPLGSDVFFVSTSCGNFCWWQPELFNEKFPPSEHGRCGYDKPCHTVEWNVYVNKLTFQNMNSTLESWGDRSFATREEADRRMKEIVEENRRTMKDMGFFMDIIGNGQTQK